MAIVFLACILFGDATAMQLSQQETDTFVFISCQITLNATYTLSVLKACSTALYGDLVQCEN